MFLKRRRLPHAMKGCSSRCGSWGPKWLGSGFPPRSYRLWALTWSSRSRPSSHWLWSSAEGSAWPGKPVPDRTAVWDDSTRCLAWPGGPAASLSSPAWEQVRNLSISRAARASLGPGASWDCSSLRGKALIWTAGFDTYAKEVVTLLTTLKVCP